MRRGTLELVVGLFILAGIGCLGYMSIRYAKMEVMGSNGYEVSAVFPTISGLKNGALVEIAGVEIGRVKKELSDLEQALASVRNSLAVLGSKPVQEAAPEPREAGRKPGRRKRRAARKVQAAKGPSKAGLKLSLGEGRI